MHSQNQIHSRLQIERQKLGKEVLKRCRSAEMPIFFAKNPEKLIKKKTYETGFDIHNQGMSSGEVKNVPVQFEYYDQEFFKEREMKKDKPEFDKKIKFKATKKPFAKNSANLKKSTSSDLLELQPQRKLKLLSHKIEEKKINGNTQREDQSEKVKLKFNKSKKKVVNFKSISKEKEKKKDLCSVIQVKKMDAKDLRKTMGSTEKDLIRMMMMKGDAYESSPKKLEYQRNELFDLTQMNYLLEEEFNDKQFICIDPTFESVRADCFKLMSRICDVLQTRRDSFFLALSIFDKSLNSGLSISNRNYKFLALACLGISLKLEQIEMSRQYIHIIEGISEVHNKTSSTLTRSFCRGKSKKKGEKCAYLEREETKSKLESVLSILTCEKCSKLSMSDYFQLELEINLKLGFRVWNSKSSFWIDILTCFWDQHILLEKQVVEDELLFRCPEAPANLVFLLQILEMAHLNMKFYHFKSSYIILSAMFLILRTSLEKNHNGFDFYRTALRKSSGILFIDKKGINQIFWSFLEKLKIEMKDILECCQFMGEFLDSTRIHINHVIESTEQFLLFESTHMFFPDLYLSH